MKGGLLWIGLSRFDLFQCFNCLIIQFKGCDFDAYVYKYVSVCLSVFVDFWNLTGTFTFWIRTSLRISINQFL